MPESIRQNNCVVPASGGAVTEGKSTLKFNMSESPGAMTTGEDVLAARLSVGKGSTLPAPEIHSIVH